MSTSSPLSRGDGVSTCTQKYPPFEVGDAPQRSVAPGFRSWGPPLCNLLSSFIFNKSKCDSLLRLNGVMDLDKPLCVAFDCDGVLADSISSWRTIHDHFGTSSKDLLQRFMAGELTDNEFMNADIALWKEKSSKIHRDDLFRAYSGCKLMKGAKEVVSDLKSAGIHVAIVSAGVDLFVQSIAGLVKADDWIANGFNFDEEGWLLDEGIVRVPSKEKYTSIQRLLDILDCPPDRLVSIGDSSMDLSMQIEGSTFIGFNPQRDAAKIAFAEAGVTVVESKDLNDLRPHIGL